MHGLVMAVTIEVKVLIQRFNFLQLPESDSQKKKKSKVQKNHFELADQLHAQVSHSRC